MRARILALVLFSTVVSVSAARAADDGQTQPRLSFGSTHWANDYFEIIPTTSGAGNVKGLQCTVNSVGVTVKMYVNGGAAQTLTIDGSTNGWIPFNVRFTSSIRVRMERAAWPTTNDEAVCGVSWGLD